jgi:protein-S-isoprenylcysteine O-methyltransferase Ste14
VSGDRLLQALLLLTILLFVSAGVLPLGRSRYPLAKWARWGAIVIFSAAVIYALILTFRWWLNRDY